MGTTARLRQAASPAEPLETETKERPQSLRPGVFSVNSINDLLINEVLAGAPAAIHGHAEEQICVSQMLAPLRHAHIKPYI